MQHSPAPVTLCHTPSDPLLPFRRDIFFEWPLLCLVQKHHVSSQAVDTVSYRMGRLDTIA